MFIVCTYPEIVTKARRTVNRINYHKPTLPVLTLFSLYFCLFWINIFCCLFISVMSHQALIVCFLVLCVIIILNTMITPWLRACLIYCLLRVRPQSFIRSRKLLCLNIAQNIYLVKLHKSPLLSRIVILYLIKTRPNLSQNISISRFDNWCHYFVDIQ